jgi:hypothetical protein
MAGVPEEDSFYSRRLPNSSKRYTTTQGQQVIEQGNKRIVIHDEPPPHRHRRFHWLLYVGVVCFLVVSGWIALTLLTTWWQAKQLDWKYGTPRTFQVDQFVGHGDSPAHPNHFIAVNVGGTIEVVEMNTTNPKADHIYLISTVTDSSMPVTVSFADLTHDGKRDMLVTVGSSYTVVLLNKGSEFQH